MDTLDLLDCCSPDGELVTVEAAHSRSPRQVWRPQSCRPVHAPSCAIASQLHCPCVQARLAGATLVELSPRGASLADVGAGETEAEAVVDAQTHGGMDAERVQVARGRPPDFGRTWSSIGGCGRIGAARKQMENCWRTSPSS